LEADAQFFSRNSKPYGKSYEQWIVEWWKWLLSIPKSQNPAFDMSGSRMGLNQPDSSVIFLCQTIEGLETKFTRKGNMLPNRGIFMPIINWISIEGEDGESDQQLYDVAKKRIDAVVKLDFRVNDQRVNINLKEYRIQSPFFEAKINKDNIFGIEPGLRRFYSDGYWVLFKANGPSLTISSFGSCSSGITNVAIEYDISFTDNHRL
jgi:hypothetical protein